MPMKDWLHSLQPVQLYIVLVLSICYFIVQLILSHITHALTLLVDSYHMLCNILALSGCILTIKHSRRKLLHQKDELKEETRFVEDCVKKRPPDQHHHELKLRNTFGWTRIDVLTMLIVCIFLASLSFSLLVEALQTLVHIDHQDTMHLPIPVLILGSSGIILNCICYILIGGYTLHQSNFLHISSNGDVVLDQVTSSKPEDRTKRDDIQTQLNELRYPRSRQGLSEMFRDISSTLFVIVCAITVYFADDDQVAKYLDPIISICSCILLLCLSYPYMKESCLILLQTIPGSIDIEIFKSTLLSTFKDIVSVHDLHIWQLTSSKYVSTVHIIFQNPVVYSKIMDDVKNFFYEQGITIVTIQPEFQTTKLPVAEECLVRCYDVTCAEKHCCIQLRSNLREIVLHENRNNNKNKTTFDLTNSLNFNYGEKSKSTNNLCVSDKLPGQLKKFLSDSRIDKEAIAQTTGCPVQISSDDKKSYNITEKTSFKTEVVVSNETK